MNDGVVEKITTYNSVPHRDILDIFGMELSYHTLKYYTRDEGDYTQVMTSIYNHDTGYRFKVWLGKDLVLNENYQMSYHSNMIIKLEAYEFMCDEEF